MFLVKLSAKTKEKVADKEPAFVRKGDKEPEFVRKGDLEGVKSIETELELEGNELSVATLKDAGVMLGMCKLVVNDVRLHDSLSVNERMATGVAASERLAESASLDRVLEPDSMTEGNTL